jgi:glycosyltransferase involved in cell wall biosynthesis
MAHLRLAIATPRFWPLPGDEPGHLAQLAESLAAAGHDVTIVTPLWHRTWPRQMTLGRVSLVRLRGALRGGWSTLRWMYSLGKWLPQAQADAVLVWGLRHEAYVALGSAAKSKAPVALVAGEGDLEWHRTATFGSRIALRCRQATAIVSPSPALAEELAASGCLREAITVIPRRVRLPPPRSPKLREDARAALAAANYDLATTSAAPVALAVGRLDAEHRFGDLVRAWRIVTAHRSEARLWIIGDGPDRERLFRQISDLDQRFRVLIPGTFDCLDELLQAADMLLVPGQHTMPPLAQLQAQAAGLPVIAADAPALREQIVADQAGLLFPPTDARALAAAVLRLLENPALAVNLGSAAREAARGQPTLDDEAAEYAELLSRLRCDP